jgi:uncharacterized membrane protein
MESTMEFGTMNLIWELLVPAFLLIYGWRWMTNAPEFGSTKGFGTKYTKKNEKLWKLGNSFAGKLCIAYGVLMLAIYGVRYLLPKPEEGEPLWLKLTSSGVNLLLILTIIPIVNLYLKRHDDDDN